MRGGVYATLGVTMPAHHVSRKKPAKRRRKNTPAQLRRQRRDEIIAIRSQQAQENLRKAIADAPHIIRKTNNTESVKLKKYTPAMWAKLSDSDKRAYAKAIGAMASVEQAKRLDYSGNRYYSAPKIAVTLNDRLWAARTPYSKEEIAAEPSKRKQARMRKESNRIRRARNKLERASQYEARRQAQHATTIADQRRREMQAQTGRDRQVFGTQDMLNALNNVNVLGSDRWVNNATIEEITTEVESRARDLNMTGKPRRTSEEREQRRQRNARRRRIEQDRRRGDIYGQRERDRERRQATQQAWQRLEQAAPTGPVSYDMWSEQDMDFYSGLLEIDATLGGQFGNLSQTQRYWLYNATNFGRLLRDNFDIVYNAELHRLELEPAHGGGAMTAIYAEMRDWMTVAHARNRR